MGYGVYFLTYEKLVQREMRMKGIKREQISPVNSVLYGAAAGYAVSISETFDFTVCLSTELVQLWAIIYPVDMIKSRMQTDGFSATTGQKYKSTLDCVRVVWRTEGIGAFTRGLGPTLIRYAFLSSCPLFPSHVCFPGLPLLTGPPSSGLSSQAG